MKKLDEMPPRYPINGTLELTHRCNLKCKMCMFRHQDCNDAYLSKNELSTDRWKQLAKEIVQTADDHNCCLESPSRNRLS